MTQEALKLALEALETELCIDWTNVNESEAAAEKMHEAIAAIKEALAQPAPLPVQKPVGSVVRWLDGSLVHGWFSDPPPEGTLLYITPPAVQPQRLWVGLTNKELFEILDKANTRYQALQMTEDKLKEKNT